MENATCESLKTHDPSRVTVTEETEWKNTLDYAMFDTFSQDEDLENLVGTFGHHALGNWTTYINESTAALMMETGSGTVFELQPLGNNTYLAQGTEHAWFYRFPVEFTLDDSGLAQSLTELLNEIPSRFNRDLEWNNPPQPPQICP